MKSQEQIKCQILENIRQCQAGLAVANGIISNLEEKINILNPREHDNQRKDAEPIPDKGELSGTEE